MHRHNGPTHARPRRERDTRLPSLLRLRLLLTLASSARALDYFNGVPPLLLSPLLSAPFCFPFSTSLPLTVS
ncbi:hypothetical protein BD289DRAFT_273914 [Coniella lustricola]|uniref:Uncharacterized protein n=1 Tax=Coniella lustricola TaxID=2025994 RepID=A0A2T3A6U1_9PEZI|nr:hypothetical protein BD289DRAFT_273914 [Coniella lustricola]